MDHGMAIGAKRSEVSNWVDRVGPPYFGNRHDVVHVNVPSAYITVAVRKVKPADHAGRAVVRDALITRGTVALIGVHSYLPYSSLLEHFRLHLIRAIELLRWCLRRSRVRTLEALHGIQQPVHSPRR